MHPNEKSLPPKLGSIANRWIQKTEDKDMYFFCWNSCRNYEIIIFHPFLFSLSNVIVATLFWKSVRMKLTLLKCGLGSPLGLPKLQGSIVGVKFALDLILIRGLSKELWLRKVPGVQTRTILGLLLGSPGTKCHSDVGAVEKHRK